MALPLIPLSGSPRDQYSELGGDGCDEEAALLSPSSSPSPPPPLPATFATPRRLCFIAFALALTLFLLLLATLFVDSTSSPSSTLLANEQAIKYRDAFHAPAQIKLDPFGTVVREAAPQTEHTVTAILLHGLGDTHHQLPFVSWLAERFPYVRWVSPQARNMNVTLRGNAWTAAWYNIATFEDLYYDEDVDGMRESQREINELIQEERAAMEKKGQEPRIVVAGFSQGAVMALLLALTAKEKLEGAMVLSGYLPLLNDSRLIAACADRDTPIFWGHGRDDPFLTFEHASESVNILRNDFSLRHLVFKAYEGLGHWWFAQEMQDVANWFGENVPKEPRRKLPLPEGEERAAIPTVEPSAVSEVLMRRRRNLRASGRTFRGMYRS